MAYIGREPAGAPVTNTVTTAAIIDDAVDSAKLDSTVGSEAVTTAVIRDNAVTNVKMADDAVGIAELSATGTSITTKFLRGDNTWAEDNNTDTFWTGVSTNLVAATGRTSLGLGTTATTDTGTGSGNVPVLNSSGKLDTGLIDSVNLSDVESFTTKALRNSSTATAWTRGGVAIITGSNTDRGSYIYTGADQTAGAATADSAWTFLENPTDAVTSVNSSTGAVTLDTPSIINNGTSDPTLGVGTGNTAAKIRALIGAGTSSSSTDARIPSSVTDDNYPRFNGTDGTLEQRTPAQVRSDIGAGTSSLSVGSGSGDALAGDTTVTNWSGTSTGLTAATGRTSLGLGTAATTNTGTGDTNTILGNDSRLANARAPTSHSHLAADLPSASTTAAGIIQIGTGAANALAGNTSIPQGTVTSITPGVGFASNTAITGSGTMNLQAGTSTEFGGLKVRFSGGVLFLRDDGTDA